MPRPAAASADDGKAGENAVDDPDATPVASASELLQAAFEDDPANSEAALAWARLQVEERNFSEAEAILSRCLAAGGNRLQLLEELEEVRLNAAQGRLEIARRRAGSHRTPEAVELLGQLQTELNRLEIEVYYQRCERYPMEAKWRFALGQSLKRAGNFVQAAKSFAESAADPEFACCGHLEIGECRQHLKQFARALQAYQQGIEVGRPGIDNRWLIAAHYRAAVLAEALGNTDATRHHLLQLQQLEPGYRDIAQRLLRVESAPGPPTASIDPVPPSDTAGHVESERSID